MTFLGNPCACGWSLDDNEDGTIKSCMACKRVYIKLNWGWEQITPLSEIVDVELCRHNKVVNLQDCIYCDKEHK